ncbi:MAG: hypothetical protein GEU93_06495 [Propionibacteriales bacterium]|nr:hypothetical protein [Propionibacteriales bacterium]
MRNGAGVAAPRFDALGNVAGALTVSLPADQHEMRRVPEVGVAMRRAADELSRRLGYTGTRGTATLP